MAKIPQKSHFDRFDLLKLVSKLKLPIFKRKSPDKQRTPRLLATFHRKWLPRIFTMVKRNPQVTEKRARLVVGVPRTVVACAVKKGVDMAYG
ncbi:hypothetical protein ES332_A08G125700v1 [Gossypium tomentosum]|uniref:Uncharacterized protein n=1 Tax=Gossypium tomentosum TaxID=34277 RepID=A0A5D2PEQ6_GOSTO|nr:hypothetical protein ES332_A08G125700v1 [Gossypium tomentosum]